MLRKLYLVSVILLISLIGFIITSTKPNYEKTNTSNIVRISKGIKILPIARVIIPDVGLDEELYNPKSSLNKVDKNVTILEKSILPDNENSILFLAAHSGNGSIAYFNNLDKLKIGQEIIIQYKKHNYYYLIDKIFEEDKDGYIEINKTSNQQLVLTTCSKTNYRKQLIINSNLTKKEEIT